MKLKFLLFALLVNLPIVAKNNPEKEADNLAKAAYIVSQAGKIFADPHDSNNVASSVANIFAGFLGLASGRYRKAPLTHAQIERIVKRGNQHEINQLKSMILKIAMIQIDSLDKCVLSK